MNENSSIVAAIIAVVEVGPAIVDIRINEGVSSNDKKIII